jgi:hypothetical protein
MAKQVDQGSAAAARILLSVIDAMQSTADQDKEMSAFLASLRVPVTTEAEPSE